MVLNLLRYGAAMVDYVFLVTELAKVEGETPWVEFKENMSEPEEIATHLCGLANSPASRIQGLGAWPSPTGGMSPIDDSGRKHAP